MTFETVTFKQIGDVALPARIFRPEANAVPGHGALGAGAPAFGQRPALIFFTCGGWNGYENDGVVGQCSYFASRGAVCFAALVRVTPVHGTSPAECVIDAKSMVRWVRARATEFGIDPAKIVTTGGSAAGHVSTCTALIDGFDDPADDVKVSCQPNAVVPYCPALVIHHSQFRVERFGGLERARALSPVLHVKKGAPPMLVQYGEDDLITYCEEGRLFKREMDRVGARCDLHIFPREGHGFQAYADGRNPMFWITHRKTDRFLVSLGYLPDATTIDAFPFEQFAPLK